MRLKLVQWAAAAFLLAAVIVPVAFTQGPDMGGGFGKGGFGKGGFGKDGGGFGGFGKDGGGFGKGGFGKDGGGGFGKGGFGDPNFMFNLTAGKDKDGNQREVIIISEYEATWGGPEATAQAREKMTAYLAKRGLPTDKMTREQFPGYLEEQRAEQAKTWAKSAFERMDKNKAGKLSKADIEASGGMFGRRNPLVDEFETYDTNKDGYIDQNEYSAYLTARMSGAGRGFGKEDKKEAKAAAKEEKRDQKETRAFVVPVVKEQPKNADSRPVVYRYGKLPTKDLPSWFTDLDTDKDGQVGLYEWRAARRSTTEFKQYDTNGDGFITAEEVIAFQRQQDANKEATAVTYMKVNAEPGMDASGVLSPGSPASPGKGGKGGFGKGGFGKDGGGFGGWGKDGGGFGKDGGGFGKGGWGKDGGGFGGWGKDGGGFGKKGRKGKE